MSNFERFEQAVRADKERGEVPYDVTLLGKEIDEIENMIICRKAELTEIRAKYPASVTHAREEQILTDLERTLDKLRQDEYTTFSE